MTDKPPRRRNGDHTPTHFDWFLHNKAMPNGTVVRRWVFFNFTAIVIFGTVCIVLLDKGLHRDQRIDHAQAGILRSEINDLTLSRSADYRLCERQNKSFAEIHWTVQQALGKAALRQREKRVPIYECEPNFHGQAAYALPRKEQRAYVRFFVKHGGTPPVVVNGRVTNKPNHSIQAPSPASNPRTLPAPAPSP